MADKSLLELPLATTGVGALIYGVQDNTDKAFPASVLQGNQGHQPANTVYAGPTSPPGNFPVFRPLIANDIPDLSAFYMKASGGELINATLNSPTILGGSISGASAVFNENEFTIRDSNDTTRTGKFNVDIATAGTSATWTLPGMNTVLVGRDTTDTLTNKRLVVTASTPTGAPIRIPHGVPPSSPGNGDLWTTEAGLFAYINNAVVGPFTAATSSTVTSFNTRVGAVTLVSADVTTALGYTPFNPTGLTVYTSDNFNPATKSDVGHTHTIANVTGLQSALDGKAASSHTHTIANVTGLQSALDAKANSSHTHTVGQVTGLQGALDAKAPLSNPNFTGAVTASGGFGPGSDPRLKDESSLKAVDNAIDILYNLNVRKGKYHSWYNPDDKERYFIMADSSMERAVPEALLRDAVESGGNKYNGWSADQMIALLVQSVKELKEEVTAMKEKIDELSN